MPFTINGIGTTFYGQRDFCRDGSFVTTEWVALLYLPIFPLCSLRIKHEGPAESRFPIGFGSAESYLVYERTFPNWKQVLCVYSFTLFMAAWIFFLASSYIGIARVIGDTFAVAGLFIAIVLPSLFPIALRIYARRNSRS